MSIVVSASSRRPPRAALLGTCLVLAMLGGCVYSAPYGPPAGYAPSTFDRAFDAALGAMTEQGFGITAQDRGAGLISGVRGGITVTASIRPQPDGTTRVAFDTRGDQSQDPALAQRILNSYNARMGR